MSTLNKRNAEIDVIKGILVIIMIFYHCASVMLNANSKLTIVTNQLDFLHTAFLVLTGFLCGWYYAPSSSHEVKQIRKRLRLRAIKLIIIFVFLNVSLYLMELGCQTNHLLLKLNSFEGIIDNLFVSVNGS